ncbi:cytosol aminopeptidase [soil metagenome]
MNIIFEGGDPHQFGSDALIVPVVQQDKGIALDTIVDDEFRSQVASLAEDARFVGKKGTTFTVPSLGRLAAKRLILAGVGPIDELSAEAIRRAWGSAITAARAAGAKRVTSTVPPSTERVDLTASVEAAVEAAEMATYQFTDHYGTVKKSKPRNDIESFAFIGSADLAELMDGGIETGVAVGAGVNLARDLSNQPASVLTPIEMARLATDVAQNSGLEIRVFDEEGLQDLSAEAMLTVGRGSKNPPRLIHLTWRPDDADESTPQIGIIGKCITFDTGGYSIKPTDGMVDMKGDMAGGAAVLGAMSAIRTLGIPVVVHCVICAAENMISGDAFRPGDVITGMNGVTMEILSTDAEGRLVLADGLVYMARQGVRDMVDLATLTGAKVVALGSQTVAMFSNDDSLARRLLCAADSAGEPMWRLPLSEHLESQIEGEVADIKNTGGRAGGAITAALFLQHFCEGVPWAHLDIAGSNRSTKATAYTPKGATGIGVRTLLEYLESVSSDGKD